MPYYRRRRYGYRRYSRSRYRRSYRRRSYRARRPRRIARRPFPETQAVKLRYVDTYNLAVTPGDGTLGGHVWRLNSIYDPDAATGGHRPYGTAVYDTQYSEYIVLGAKATLLITAGTTGTSFNPTRVGLWMHNSTTAPSTMNTALKIMENPAPQVSRLITAEKPTATMTWKYSAKRWYYPEDPMDQLDRNRGLTGGLAVGSNPTTQANLFLWYDGVQQSSSQLKATIKIEYVVRYMSRKEMAPTS